MMIVFNSVSLQEKANLYSPIFYLICCFIVSELAPQTEHLALPSYTDVGDGLEFYHFDHFSLDILEERLRFLRLYLRTRTVLKYRVWLLRLTTRKSRNQQKFCQAIGSVESKGGTIEEQRKDVKPKPKAMYGREVQEVGVVMLD